MGDIKDVAIEQMAKNFPLLAGFLEDVTLTSKGERSYNATTGIVTTTDSTETFRAMIVKAQGGSQFGNYPIANIVDSPFKVGDLKLIVPCSYITGTPKNDDVILRSKTSMAYRIFGVYNVSDVAYLLYIRSVTDETS